jgi:hypothetical protein
MTWGVRPFIIYTFRNCYHENAKNNQDYLISYG